MSQNAQQGALKHNQKATFTPVWIKSCALSRLQLLKYMETNLVAPCFYEFLFSFKY